MHVHVNCCRPNLAEAPGGVTNRTTETFALLGLVRTAAQECSASLLWAARDGAPYGGSLARAAGSAAAWQAHRGVGGSGSGGAEVAEAAEAAERGGAALVPRLLAAGVAQRSSTALALLPMPRGSLLGLGAAPAQLAAGGAAGGWVVLAVRAVGLNFRDVLNVLVRARQRCPGPHLPRAPATASDVDHHNRIA